MARSKAKKQTKKANLRANASPAQHLDNNELPPHSGASESCSRCEKLLFVITESTKPDKADDPSRFLSLPLELRNDIYIRVLPKEQHYELLPDLRIRPKPDPRRDLMSLIGPADNDLPPFPDLLLVNKQVYEEAAFSYYSSNSLHIVEHVTIKQLNAIPARIKRVAALPSSSLKHTKDYKLELWIMPDELFPDQGRCLGCARSEFSTGIIVEFKENKLSGRTFQIEAFCNCSEIMAGGRLKKCQAIYDAFKKVFREREDGVEVEEAMGHNGAIDYGRLLVSFP